ncbi:uncharacterized protein V6R79_023540 [Siganus canaliculatus]
MASAALCGKNMKNVLEERGLKRVKCPERRGDIMYASPQKQCIESEKLFDFLKDLVEQATSTASQKDTRRISVWPLYRSKHHEMSVNKPAEVVETAPRASLDSLDNDSTSSESELFICF